MGGEGGGSVIHDLIFIGMVVQRLFFSVQNEWNYNVWCTLYILEISWH